MTTKGSPYPRASSLSRGPSSRRSSRLLLGAVASLFTFFHHPGLSFAKPKAHPKPLAPFESYRSGISLLATDPAGAERRCRDAHVEESLAPWAELCVAHALFERGKRQESANVARAIPDSSAASLHARTLLLEIAPVNAQWKTELTALEETSHALDLPELRPSLLSLRARQAAAEGDKARALQLYQEVRGGGARPLLAKRAREAQEAIFSTATPNPKAAPKGLSLDQYWKKEIELLVSEEQKPRALALANALIARTPAKSAPKEHFALLKARWKLLDSKAGVKQVAHEKETIEKDASSPLRRYLLADRAMALWRERSYDAARLVLAELPTDDADRLFIEARLAEIDLDFETAKRGYRGVLASTGAEQRLTAGLRLFWLLVEERQWRDAGTVGTELAKVGATLPRLDLQAVQYWSTVANHESGIVGTKNEPEFLSVYFWLSKGLSLAKPHSSETRMSLRTCMTEYTGLPALPSHIRDLLRFGLVEAASQELRYHFKDTRTPLAIVTRARLLSAYVSHAAAWNEVRAQMELPAAYFGECGRDVLNIVYPMPYLDTFRREATKNGVPLALVLALSRTESAFNPGAMSPVGAVGLMQLMPATAKLEGLRSSNAAHDLRAVDTNVTFGVKHLARLIREQEGKWHYTVASYNAGKAAVDRWIQNHPDAEPPVWTELIPYKETREYVKRVLAAYWVYSWLLSDDAKMSSPHDNSTASLHQGGLGGAA